MAAQDTDSLEEQLNKLEAAAEAEEPNPIMKFLPVLLAVGAFAVFGLIAAFALTGGDDEPGEIKLAAPVLSPEGATKIETENPGGLEIANQDNTAANLLTQGSDDGKVESVLAGPEEPMKPPEGGAEAAQGMTGADGGGEMLAQPQEAAPLPETATAEAGKTETPGVETPRQPAGTDAQVATAEPPAMPPAVDVKATKATPPVMSDAKVTGAQTSVVSTQQTASLNSNYRVQIQSLRSQSRAEKAWLSQVKKHPDLFGDLSLTIQRAVIQDRGTFYRVQAGPFAKREAADSLCRKLKIRGQDCLVVRP